jgi:hypothetical protein
MFIPHDEIAQRFVSAALDAVPVAGVYGNMAQLKTAGAELQRMVILFDSHSTNRFSLSEEALQNIVEAFHPYNFSAHQEPLTRFFGRQLLHHAQEVRPEGLLWLARETEWSLESLQRLVGTETRAPAGRIFSSVHNIGMGLCHTFGFQKGAEGRNWGAGALGYAGALAILDGTRRALIGTQGSAVDEHGEPQWDAGTERHWLSGATEAAAGLSAIAAALKIAEKNMLRLK